MFCQTQRMTASAVSLGFVLKQSFACGAFACTTLINFSKSRKLLGINRMPAPINHAVIRLRLQHILDLPLGRFTEIDQTRIHFVSEAVQLLAVCAQSRNHSG
jgi:S-adenosylhomocysteine hydrolase